MTFRTAPNRPPARRVFTLERLAACLGGFMLALSALAPAHAQNDTRGLSGLGKTVILPGSLDLKPDASDTASISGPGTEAAPQGSDNAYGAFQRGFFLTSLQLALPRAQSGDPAAQTLVAEIFAGGLGVTRNLDDAAFWYGKAANGGDPNAQMKYALLLMEGRHVARDEERALALMRRAADTGLPEAQFNTGQMMLDRNPGDAGILAALPFFEKAARAGVPDAQYVLADIYSNAVDIPAHKREMARSWLERAARAGHDEAALELGLWLIEGISGPKDYETGFFWMRVAANRSLVLAQNRLAYLYINAIGTRGDRIEAAKWYLLSRRAGLEDPALDVFYKGLSDDEKRAAVSAANAFHLR